MSDLRETAAVLALVNACKAVKFKWHHVASMIEEAGSARQLISGDWQASEAVDRDQVLLLATGIKPTDLDEYERAVISLSADGIRVVTVLDPDYPANLREVYNRPPVLFIRGVLLDRDVRAVAVVGTREASAEGLKQARHLAMELARRDITVLSGLARGIDTAAHEGALEAGGRTVAVMGTGINLIYPPENELLAERIERVGALVSQFTPDSPPAQWSFPMRNAVMSGMALGTAVIEAGPTSGAKGQARLALEHGKRLFLIESLVLQQDWAREYATRPGATVVSSASEIIDLVENLTASAKTLTLF